ncbi:hypothetical protein Poli38472_001076 [Pythium oligandrum]|uniref:Microsomal glutathione S-transferase 1 n=1 Tax=Pythium oligandrum TaxID=41045 RepID=A0A8K1CST0_PYTOL|nr:hypothetical protein Poli38472_001076 [Pythium oligandrum]|eukprot:TMW68920.1 hypothetical protein Poli38472_001076 [Pythium oligandrum]
MVASLNVRVYVACAAVLYFKFLGVIAVQAGKTFRAGGRPPEDNSLRMARGHLTQNYGLNSDEKDEKILKAREVELRWRRIVANDLESIPFALFIFAGGVMANANETVFAASMIVYTIARCLHTRAYAKARQPARAIYWFLAITMILVGMANALLAAFF